MMATAPDRCTLLTMHVCLAEVRIYWHPQGDYVAVQVDRYTKTRKSTYTSFELFSVKDKDIPMEVLELPNKTDKVIDFAWEPRVSLNMQVHAALLNMQATLLDKHLLACGLHCFLHAYYTASCMRTTLLLARVLHCFLHVYYTASCMRTTLLLACILHRLLHRFLTCML